jgi:uncharacterized protein (TIGR02145 family)
MENIIYVGRICLANYHGISEGPMNKLIIILNLFSSVCFSQTPIEAFMSQNKPQGLPEYGFYYNQYATSDADFAPSGWRVPSYTDLETLQTYLTEATGGGKLKETGTTHWTTPNTGADNSTGFTLFGAGVRASNGVYNYFNTYGFVASNTIAGPYLGGMTTMYNNDDLTGTAMSGGEKVGAPIRLVKNNSTNPTTLTDYDGNVYDCITIDTMVWTVQNWLCTHLTDGTEIPLVQDNTAWAALTTMGRSRKP